MVVCDEIVYVIDTVSTNVVNTVSRNKTNTISTNVSTNFNGKNIRLKMDCYILHTVLLVTVLLFIITIICYHYTKHRLKTLKKRIDVLVNGE